MDIIRLSLISSVIGLIVLYFLLSNMTPEKVEIKSIGKNFIGKNVATVGFVKNLKESGENRFFELTDNKSSISVVEFNYNEYLENGEKILLYGHVDVYKNSLEIIANKIISLSS